MSFVHNRIGMVALVAALAVVLLGSGCDREQPLAGRSGATQPTSGDARSGQTVGDRGSTATLPTRWTEYRSASLGVTIPYPEGWWVEEFVSQRRVNVYQAAPPDDSDAPASYSYWVRQGDVAQALTEFLTTYETREDVRAGIRMIRVVYPYDVEAEPDTRMVAYLWEISGATHVLSGPEGSEALERAVDRMEVRR